MVTTIRYFKVTIQLRMTIFHDFPSLQLSILITIFFVESERTQMPDTTDLNRHGQPNLKSFF